jgi:hypothetical protein
MPLRADLECIFFRATCGPQILEPISAPGSVCSGGSYNQAMSPDKLSDVAMEKMTAEKWNAVREICRHGAANGEAAGVA